MPVSGYRQKRTSYQTRCAWFDFLGKNGIDHQFAEVIVLGLTVLVWRINTLVDWVEIFLLARAMHQIDDANGNVPGHVQFDSSGRFPNAAQARR